MGKSTEAVTPDAPTTVSATIEVQDITRSIVKRDARGTIVATFLADSLLTVTPEALGLTAAPFGCGVTVEAFPVKRNGGWMAKIRVFVQTGHHEVVIPHEDLGEVAVLDPLTAEKVIDLGYLAEFIARGMNFDYGQRQLGTFASRKEEHAWMVDFGDHADPAKVEDALRHPGLMRQVSHRLRAVLAGDKGFVNWPMILERRNEELRDRLAIEVEKRLLEDKEAAARAVGRQLFETMGVTHLRDVPSTGKSMVSSVFSFGEKGAPNDEELLRAMALRFGPAVQRQVVREGIPQGTIVVVTIDI